MNGDAIREARTLLSELPRFADAGATAYKPGLERMNALLAALGDPQKEFPAVHVAGTNGKGSTASFIASIATATGRRTALHTSPHLLDVTERMRVGGRPASEEWLADALLRARPLIEDVAPSFFEVTAALSFLYFAEQRVDLAVVEVGMGGRLDATNVIEPELAVITEIGLDHAEFLGNTVEDIAAEKAGIIKPKVPVVTGARSPAVEVIRRTASRKASALHAIDEEIDVIDARVDLHATAATVRSPLRTYPDLAIGLAGRHQVRNAVTALRAAELLFEEVERGSEPIYRGLGEVRALSGLRGRMDVLCDAPVVVADVAHNADGLAAVIEHLRECGGLKGRLDVLLGVMRDKDVASMGRLLAAESATVHPVPVESDRAMTPRELAQALQVVDVNVAEPRPVREGIRIFLSGASRADTLLVAGSHLVVAQLESSSP